jgi:hypothetical protein
MPFAYDPTWRETADIFPCESFLYSRRYVLLEEANGSAGAVDLAFNLS